MPKNRRLIIKSHHAEAKDRVRIVLLRSLKDSFLKQNFCPNRSFPIEPLKIVNKNCARMKEIDEHFGVIIKWVPHVLACLSFKRAPLNMAQAIDFANNPAIMADCSCCYVNFHSFRPFPIVHHRSSSVRTEFRLKAVSQSKSYWTVEPIPFEKWSRSIRLPVLVHWLIEQKNWMWKLKRRSSSNADNTVRVEYIA